MIKQKHLTLNSFKKIQPEILFLLLRDLPDFHMAGKHGLLMEFNGSDDDIKFFNHVRLQYRATSDWLIYYHTGNLDLAQELKLTVKGHYKPLGDLSRAWLNLTKEYFLLDGEFQQRWRNPHIFWFLTEIERFTQGLAKHGFSTDKPEIVGNSERYKNIIKVCDSLGNSQIKDLVKTHITKSPSETLLSKCVELTIQPGNTQFKKRWWDFLKDTKRGFQEIRDSKQLRVICIDDGVLREFSRGKRKKNGFGN